MYSCPTCGEQLAPHQQTCIKCNTAIAVGGTSATKSTDTLSLVFGILGLFLCCCLPIPIVAVVVAKTREKTHNTKAAFICGIIGLVLGILYWIGYFALITAGVLTEFMPYMW